MSRCTECMEEGGPWCPGCDDICLECCPFGGKDMCRGPEYGVHHVGYDGVHGYCVDCFECEYCGTNACAYRDTKNLAPDGGPTVKSACVLLKEIKRLEGEQEGEKKRKKV